MMLLVPNAIALVLVFVEENIPVVKSKPFSANAPEVNVVVPPAICVYASPKVVVPEWLMVNPAIVLPVEVNVPVPKKFIVNPVYVPVAVNVNVFTFNVVATGVQELPVKSNLPNIPDDVKVGTADPEVNDRFGALDEVPLLLVEAKLNVLVTVIAEVNPPVPV